MRWIPATPTSVNRATRLRSARAVTAASSATGKSLVPAVTIRIVPRPVGSGEPGRQGGAVRRLRARRQEAARRGDEPLRDRHDLLGRFLLAQDHLLVPLGEGSEVIDGGERQALDETGQIVELHAACSTALPARWAAKIVSASRIDSIWNSRSRRPPAPGTPFVYQPKCLRNSSAVLRVSPWSASARRACSSATAKRSAAVGAGRGGRPATRSRACANSH